MRIHGVMGPRIVVDLGVPGEWGSNTVQLITGQNGSGKSELLGNLIDVLGQRREFKSVGPIVHQTGFGPMSRVVAQTFSPFTRFPKPEADDRSLTRLYLHEADAAGQYFCIGLNRATRSIGAALSKRILEQALFRLSEAPESVKVTTQVMRSLGFDDGMQMMYGLTSSLKSLIGRVGTPLFAQQLRSGQGLKLSKRSSALIANELNTTSAKEFFDVLMVAIETLQRLDPGKDGIVRYTAFSEYRAASEHHIVQALALLRRLELLTLKACLIRSAKRRLFFDIGNASSGQQQMLCSIISLATTVRNESLILIDEPELSLHPKWQMTYLQHLRTLLSEFRGCHVLIATHSPIIVERAMDAHAGVVSMDDERLNSQQVAHPSIEATLIDVFKAPVSGSAHVANEIFKAVTAGEPGTQASWVDSLKKLNDLRAIFEQGEAQDSRTLSLIRDAIELVESMMSEVASDNEGGTDE